MVRTIFACCLLVLVASMAGCRMCASPYDYCGPTSMEGAGIIGQDLSDLLAACDVGYLFVQGRRQVRKPTHPIPSIREEVAMLSEHYRLVAMEGECASMELR